MSFWVSADVSIPQCFTLLCLASFSLLCVSIKLHLSHVPSTKRQSWVCKVGRRQGQLNVKWALAGDGSAFLPPSYSLTPLGIYHQLHCLSNISSVLHKCVQLSAHDKFVHMCICHICAHVHMTNANCWIPVEELGQNERQHNSSKLCLCCVSEEKHWFHDRCCAKHLGALPSLPGSLALSLPGVAGTAAEFQLQTCGCIGRRVCQIDREQSLFSWKHDELWGLGESGGRTSEK